MNHASPPANEAQLPIMIPWVGEAEARGAADVVASGWLTQGPRTAEFERLVAEYAGTRHAVAVSNCTTALHLTLAALNVGPGDEVVCPSMSFIATANSIRHTGATPVFADVDPRTYNLDVRAAAAAITPRTKALLVVHQIGLPADLDGFLRLGERHGLPVVEDAACALGSRYRGRAIGGHGIAACFSFHPRKVITTGEGGMITTNDSALDRRLRLMRQHGMSVSDAARHAAKSVILEEYLVPGYNYRLTDLQAAVGIAQMARLETILARRRELAASYERELIRFPWLLRPYVPEECEPNFQSYAVQLTTDAPLSRSQLMQSLWERGIQTRRGIMLAHREQAYRDLPTRRPLSNSESASDRSLLLPLFPQMTDADVRRVAVAIAEAAAAVPAADRRAA